MKNDSVGVLFTRAHQSDFSIVRAISERFIFKPMDGSIVNPILMKASAVCTCKK